MVVGWLGALKPSRPNPLVVVNSGGIRLDNHQYPSLSTGLTYYLEDLLICTRLGSVEWYG